MYLCIIPMYLCIYLFIYLSIYLSIYPSIYLSSPPHLSSPTVITYHLFCWGRNTGGAFKKKAWACQALILGVDLCCLAVLSKGAQTHVFYHPW